LDQGSLKCAIFTFKRAPTRGDTPSFLSYSSFCLFQRLPSQYKSPCHNSPRKRVALRLSSSQYLFSGARGSASESRRKSEVFGTPTPKFGPGLALHARSFAYFFLSLRNQISLQFPQPCDPDSVRNKTQTPLNELTVLKKKRIGVRDTARPCMQLNTIRLAVRGSSPRVRIQRSCVFFLLRFISSQVPSILLFYTLHALLCFCILAPLAPPIDSSTNSAVNNSHSNGTTNPSQELGRCVWNTARLSVSISPPSIPWQYRVRFPASE
jgi:hypothetical protein